jgi:two-component system sensor histidine kinase/response regulator
MNYMKKLPKQNKIQPADVSEKSDFSGSSTNFRDFFDYSLALFCTHDYEGKLLSINPAAAAALGYTPEQLTGRNLAEVMTAEALELMPAYIHRIQSHGEAQGLMNVVTKSGEKRIWSYNNVRRIGADGNDYVLGCAQDITELKCREEELTQSRQMFQSFMNNSPAIMFLKDEAGKYVFINELFEQLFQVTLEKLQGKTDVFYLSEDVAADVMVNDQFVLESEESLRTVEIAPTPDGNLHYWLSHKFLIRDEAGKKFVGGIALDITERQKMEDELKATRDAALESARLKSAFLANISHEIRTPMNGVIGMTELLLDTPLDRVQRDYAETIRQSSDALLTVINDVLDLAKIEAGKLRFENVDFDIREVVESTVEMLAERAYRKNIEIASLVEADVPQILSSDPGRLRQVLTNLISNAVKFTDSGEIGVIVKIEKETEKNLNLRFIVTDTGIGISKDELKNLFQPFTQADSSTTRQFGGTGLGLAISKQIVEMMNGKITVESQPQKGSQFSFTACFVKKTNYLDTKQTPDVNLSNLLKGQKILIADSSSIIRRTLKQYCAIWEMNAVEAASGEEVLRLLYAANQTGESFDLAVIDMNLPDWEGFSLARKIKLDEDLSNTDIILTTVYGQRGDGATAQEIGVAAYLTKPVRGSQFFDCLATVAKENQKHSETISESNLVTRHSLREAKAQTEPLRILFANDTFPVLAVEDNETNRFLITRQLEQIGIHADVAVDGVDALDKIAARDYRLVLMDCQMPRLDGYETTRRIRRMEKEKAAAGANFSPLVVIALTAHTLAGEREKCLAAGMNDYLSKPVKIKDLATLIQYWCKDDCAQSSKTDNEAQTVSDGDLWNLNFLADEMKDNDFAAEIYTLYLTETEKRIEELKLAVDKKDAEKIARIAHAVRGNSLAVGLSSIAQITGEIQELGRQNKFEDIPERLAEFIEEFSLLQTHLHPLRAGEHFKL